MRPIPQKERLERYIDKPLSAYRYKRAKTTLDIFFADLRSYHITHYIKKFGILMILSGSPANQFTVHTATHLHLAIQIEDYATAALLLAAGANHKSRNYQNQSPLELFKTIKNFHPRMKKLLKNLN